MRSLNSLPVLCLLLSLFVSPSVFAYKMTVYTDQPDQSKAREVIRTFQSTYPFNQFEIDFEIKTVTADELNCSPFRATKADGTEEVINRNLSCNSENIARDAASRGVDQAMIVKNVSEYGGSGGSIPVISAGSTARMMLHEYLHALGLCDEYEYAAGEAEIYCGSAGPNMVFIQPEAAYTSDRVARNKHSDAIPWYEFIKTSTQITRGNPLTLGTGNVNASVYATPNSTSSPSTIGSVIGLYEGKTCRNASPPKKTWQPGQEATIMEFLDAGLGAGNEELVAKILQSKGVRRKAVPPPPAETIVHNGARAAKDPAVRDADPESSSNTSR